MAEVTSDVLRESTQGTVVLVRTYAPVAYISNSELDRRRRLSARAEANPLRPGLLHNG
jgi:hypothetical protein